LYEKNLETIRQVKNISTNNKGLSAKYIYSLIQAEPCQYSLQNYYTVYAELLHSIQAIVHQIFFHFL